MENPGRVQCDALSLEDWFPTFRSIVLPSHSRPRDPLMWEIRAFETSGTIYSMTQRHGLIKLPLLPRCRKVSIDPHYIFRYISVNKLLKQVVPSFVVSVSLYVVCRHPEYLLFS